MKLKKNYEEIKLVCTDNFIRIEQEFNRLEKFVMESKKFETFALYSIIFFYAYIIFHIVKWIGRIFF